MIKVRILFVLFISHFFFSCKESSKEVEVNNIKHLSYIQARDSVNKYYLIGLDKAIDNDLQGGLINLDKAISFQTDSLPLNDRAEHYQSRALVKSSLHDYEGALNDLNLAIELDSLYRVDITSFGLIKLHTKYSKFVEGGDVEPKFQSVNLAKRANVKIALGDYIGAMKDFNSAIIIEPGHSINYLYRGVLKVKLGDLRGGIQDFSKAIELKPDFGSAYIERGIVKMKLNEFEPSISDFNKAIELDPNDPIPFYNRGLAKLKFHDKEGGCLDLSTAGEKGNVNAYELIRQHCN